MEYKYIGGVPCACYHCGAHIISGKYELIRGKYTCDKCLRKANKIVVNS